jgi:hypothetical protein
MLATMLHKGCDAELLGRSEDIANAENLVMLYDQVLPGVLQVGRTAWVARLL